ncbi:hypothetical protein [Consotaella aegiceratis]|uniref:hypothetical protein n=1 Tax=Consotaella aegiceratis TaxID=3097961 RepID=UPI002F3F719A
MLRKLVMLVLGLTILPAFCLTAEAQDAPASKPSLSLELNAVRPSQTGCRLGFVVHNGLPGALERAAFEVVLFNKDGLIDRLLVLDFGALAQDKTKVREFDLKDTDCGTLSRVLLNDVAACEGADEADGGCMAALQVSSRAQVGFGL